MAGQLVISAQTNPASSRAMAVTASAAAFPRAVTVRYLPCGRRCAFQERAMVSGAAPCWRRRSVAPMAGWRSWKAILRQAQVRDARVHDAWHTAATLLIEQGVHIRVVQEVLGHTRVTTTERYTHVATLQMKDASERMDQALWGER